MHTTILMRKFDRSLHNPKMQNCSYCHDSKREWIGHILHVEERRYWRVQSMVDWAAGFDNPKGGFQLQLLPIRTEYCTIIAHYVVYCLVIAAQHTEQNELWVHRTRKSVEHDINISSRVICTLHSQHACACVLNVTRYMHVWSLRLAVRELHLILVRFPIVCVYVYVCIWYAC